MNHPVGAPMMTGGGHGAPIGFPGPTLGQQQPAPGQTGPAGPTPPLEEDRGATSASVLDFFAKASTQSSTSPHHQMMEASAFTSVPPPPLISGGPPLSLPAPRTLLPPVGPPAHQVLCLEGVIFKALTLLCRVECHRGLLLCLFLRVSAWDTSLSACPVFR